MHKYVAKMKSLTYPRAIALGYLVVILFGTALLSLPISSENLIYPGFMNTLFTSVSATCVTGLVVFDTYTQWSTFGEVVILSLIQIGGLGFMTVFTLFSIAIKRKITIKERGILSESVNTIHIGGVVRLTKKICRSTIHV